MGGLTNSGIVAPMLIDGPINGDSFKAYVEQVLAPVIRPGDMVVLDNLSSHKTAMVRKTLEDYGIRTRYLPPYSPDLNPIENAFSKLKGLVKSAGQRTIAGLWDVVGQLIDQFSSEECSNYFSHCGYDSKPICKEL